MFPEEIKERLEEVKEIKDKEKELVKVAIKYGNTHELLRRFKTLKNGRQNKHRWKAYVRVDDRELKPEKLIKSVEFQLDESFPKSLIIRPNPPFEFQMVGWGEFEIPIKITWQSWLKRPPTYLEFPLSFQGGGKQRSFVIKINKDDLAINTKAEGKLTGIERLIRKRKVI